MIMEKDTLIRVKDNEGNEYILYPATKLENVIGADEALNKKANVEYVNQELTKKADAEEMTEALSAKVNVSDNEIAMSQKADLQNGVIPDEQLPYYNKTHNVYVDGVLLYPITFVDIDKDNRVYLREDGSGEYLLYIPADGIPRVKYMGNAVVDKVTGAKYNLSVSNGVVVMKEIA